MTSQKRWILVAVVLGSGIVFLDSTVVNVALPRIGEELQSSALGKFAAENFVYYSYLLSLSALLILAGALNDYLGRRRMFAVGLVGFGATSILCGAAPTIELLIAFRILQGAAGALLVPGSLAIITTEFEGEEQGRAFGLWAGASAATTLLGPFVGGVLVDSVSWRAVFFINIPLVVVAVYATLRHVPESRSEEASGHFDWFGAAIVFLAVGGLSFGAILGQQDNWRGALPYIALGVGAVATVGLPIWLLNAKHPLIPPKIFRSRNFTVTNISTLLIYGALYVTFAFLGIFLQGTLGYSPAAAGLVGIPSSIPLALFSTRFGKLAARHGPRLYMTVGPAIMALGVLWYARIPASSMAWVFGTGPGKRLLPPGSYVTDLLPAYIVFGIGLMMMVAPLTTALMNSVPKQNSGVGSAVNNAISRVGPQLAGAVIFIVIAGAFYSSMSRQFPTVDTSSQRFRTLVAPLNPPDPSVAPAMKSASRTASTDSLHLGMFIAGGLLLAGAAVNGFGIKNPRGPEWMRQPKDADQAAIPRFGPERAEAAPTPAPSSRGRPPPWASKRSDG